MKIKLYIEGGGDSALQDTLFREGWRTFFEKAGLTGQMPSTFRGGGRNKTFDAYRTAVRTRKADELPLLLVDSEELVEAGTGEWKYLERQDGWQQPEGSGDEDVFLMICCMETWFLADIEALRNFFRTCWQDSAVPQWPELEKVPKQSILDAISRATAGCGKRAYSKGKPSFQLLKEIDPALVEEKCVGARLLLERLRRP